MQRLSIVLVVVLVAALDVAAKDWRGLLPMHSTHADVKNLLGPGAAPPVPDPTVDPKDVEIVYPKKRRPRSRNH